MKPAVTVVDEAKAKWRSVGVVEIQPLCNRYRSPLCAFYHVGMRHMTGVSIALWIEQKMWMVWDTLDSAASMMDVTKWFS